MKMKFSKKIQNAITKCTNIARGFCILTSHLMYLLFLSILSLQRRIALVVIAWLDRQDRILNREEFISRGSHPLIVSFETRKSAITSARVLRERIYADILRRLIIFCFRAYHAIPRIFKFVAYL